MAHAPRFDLGIDHGAIIVMDSDEEFGDAGDDPPWEPRVAFHARAGRGRGRGNRPGNWIRGRNPPARVITKRFERDLRYRLKNAKVRGGMGERQACIEAEAEARERVRQIQQLQGDHNEAVLGGEAVPGADGDVVLDDVAHEAPEPLPGPAIQPHDQVLAGDAGEPDLSMFMPPEQMFLIMQEGVEAQRQEMEAHHDRRIRTLQQQLDTAQSISRTQSQNLIMCLCSECAEVAVLKSKYAKCPAGHPMCGECLDHRLEGAIANADDSSLLCTECAGLPGAPDAPAPLPLSSDAILSASTTTTFDRYKTMLAEKAALAAAQAESTRILSDHSRFIAEGLTLKTPCCETPFLDFDGCCAVQCRKRECGRSFCAYCWNLSNNTDDCHRHVASCELNPNQPEFYAMTPLARAILHLSFEAQRARQLNGGERFAAPTDADP